jgi:hypothetical protein
MDYLIAILGIALLGGVWITVERLAGKQGRELEKARCTGCDQDCQG